MLAYPVGLSPYPFLSLKHGLILIPHLSLLSFRDLSNRFTQPQIPRSSPFSFLSLPFPTISHRQLLNPHTPYPNPHPSFSLFFLLTGTNTETRKPKGAIHWYILEHLQSRRCRRRSGVFWREFKIKGALSPPSRTHS